MRTFLLTGMLLILVVKLQGQRYEGHPLILETTLFDAPYQVQTGQFFPSMEQTLLITKNYYQLSSLGTGHMAHYFISDTANGKGVWREVLKGIFDIGFHIGTLAVPGGHAWLHEEYHAIIGRNNGVHGKNLVYKFPPIDELITVYDVDDADLIRMKAASNPDFVRMSAAGLEGQTHLVTRLQTDHFFYNTTKAMAQNWFIIYHNNRYIGTLANQEFALDEESENEDISTRDLVGWDPTAWVYDLFHPDEAYENRGVHPTGIGIDRYIETQDLEQHEIEYLQKQSRLATLGFVDPFLLGFRRFRIGNPQNPLYFNANLKHYLTSFGHSLQTNVFLESGNLKGIFKVLQYANYERQFLGFEAQLFDLKPNLLNNQVLLSPRLAAWTQPEDQEFKTTSAQFGGLLGIRTFFPLTRNFWATLELESKTAGWVVSNPYLKANTSARVGLRWHVLSD